MARAIDADKAIEVAQIKYNDWNLAMAAADGRREINLCFKKQELFKAVKAVIDCVPTLTPPNKWVSVEERLPAKKQDVLMYFDTGNMAVGWWHDKDEHITFWCAYTDDGFYADCDCIPTHWMPLPAPPDRRPPEGEKQ